MKIFIGAEDVGKDHYWQFYPTVFLAEDILRHPVTGEMRVRKNAQALLYGGMGDGSKEQTLDRMRDFAKGMVRGGSDEMRNLRISGMSQQPFGEDTGEMPDKKRE